VEDRILARRRGGPELGLERGEQDERVVAEDVGLAAACCAVGSNQSPTARWEPITARTSTDGDSSRWTSWNRPSGSPE
jgi:hypothetical protein